jgi:signal peptidase II
MLPNGPCLPVSRHLDLARGRRNLLDMAIIPDGAAARSRRVRWVMAGVAAVVVVADQVTKSLVAAGRIADGSSFGWVTVNVVRNHGASGGIASGYPILVTIAALAITGLAAALALRAGGRTAAICLAAVLGGALGNLSDRIFRSPGFGRGGVVDWIHFAGGGGSLDVSDLAIQFGVLGAVAAMLVSSYVQARRAKRSAEQPEPR